MPADAVIGNAAVEALKNLDPHPGVAKPDPVLVADGVVRQFGGLRAVDVSHLEVQRGAITALIGPNGAGKSTFFNVISGFDTANEGTWSYNNQTITNTAPNKLARRGLVRTFQLTKSLSRLTVLQNMLLGAKGQTGENLFSAIFKFSWSAQEQANTKRAMELLGRFNLAQKSADFAGSLSGGQRKLLEMARALMLNPDLVMLDEPMAGVNPALKQSLLDHIRDIREEGTTVMFVEHDMDMVRDVSDWVVVMAQGAIISEGTPASVMRDQRVIDAYLGAHHDEALTDSGQSLTTAEETDA
ncbi:MAG: ABC transporter ATP-binding protein [Actinomycetes bacterium]|jgi:neutral amino acid transport system ATP-binding protein|nr:ABC transporter ATP-binding protein [Candidatus Nanopelagicales bacterium]MDP4888804.1 ABC transporter ATP-binding protein [Candidatus Nanopelagicales bacterium]